MSCLQYYYLRVYIFGLLLWGILLKENCDPDKNCKPGDFVDAKIASCKEFHEEQFGRVGRPPRYEFTINPGKRCTPLIRKPTNVYANRVIDISVGDPKCVPRKYMMRFECGHHGTRCVCDTRVTLDKHPKAQCRCQWHIDYCKQANVCTSGSKCSMFSNDVTCTGGSVNQCSMFPDICQNEGASCIELLDPQPKWVIGSENTLGVGYLCMKDQVKSVIENKLPYCNAETNHVNLTTETGVRTPSNHLEFCCYSQLVCAPKAMGGSLFRTRPCHCDQGFRKCLAATPDHHQPVASELLRLLNQLGKCTIGEMCDPRSPGMCEKGDLVDTRVAACRINCKSGPLLPIEERTCRIRQCTPPNAGEGVRVVDVPYFRESSRCDALMKGVPVVCGAQNTRCVCDSQPVAETFTDRCRCQYWPPV